MSTLASALQTAREATVLEHLAVVNRHDVDGVLATFHRPTSEVNGERFDGTTAMRSLLDSLFDAFPDLHVEPSATHHTESDVIAEGRMTGTHRGTFIGVAATGRRIDLPVIGVFEFDGDRLVNERITFDSGTLFRQLGAFPVSAPTHPG